MLPLSEDIAEFDAQRAVLEADHFGQWVVIQDRRVAGFFNDFEGAAIEAVARFGRGPYLIRQIGASQGSLSASVLYRPANGGDSLRV